MLLRFSASNHRSLRDTAELSLVSSNLKTTTPLDDNWLHATVRCAGIYGPNAAGKSNVLGAIQFARTAIQSSATTWGDKESFPHHPFRLDPDFVNAPSSYEFDFVFSGIRFEYGFISDKTGIQEEWLHSYPRGRKRRLFSRLAPDASDMEFSRTLPGENLRTAKITRPTALFLSMAANSNHEFLRPIQRYLSHSVRYARFSEQDRESRLRWTRELLENPDVLKQAESLLRFADVGISQIKLHRQKLDGQLNEFWQIFQKSLKESGVDSTSNDSLIEEMEKTLRFGHEGVNAEPIYFDIPDESSGTRAWLALAVPALQVIQRGHTLMVDELDASLHPRLSSALVSMFKDEELNPKGAQLIFTSHDATLLGQFSHSPLEPDEIWFCEKDRDGSTDLFALAEYPTRSGDNFERRYLQGRYGAVPMISSEDLREALRVPDNAGLANQNGE